MADPSIIPSAITAFWIIVGVILPYLFAKGPNRPLIRTCLLLTAVCAWLFWAFAYLFQMRPLRAPVLKRKTVLATSKLWNFPLVD